MTHAERAERRAAIARWVQDGSATASDAASHFGVGLGTVYAACRAAGVVPAEDMRRSRRSNYRVIADLINTDDSLYMVAERHRLSQQRIGQIYHGCLQSGVPVKKRTKKAKGGA